MIPLLFVALIGFFQMKHLINELDISLKKSYESQFDMVSSRLEGISKNQNYAVKIISSTKEIANAMEINDNNTLFEWGMNFMSDKVRYFIFLDTGGTVISRSPDEFRFGDNMSDSFVFKKLKMNSKYYGIAVIDGDEQLVCGGVIKKYGEYPVGYIITYTPIDQKLSEILSVGIDGDVRYRSDSKSSMDTMKDNHGEIKELNYTYMDNEVKNPTFHIHLNESSEHRSLIDLKNNIIWMSVITYSTILIILLLVFRIHFKPYKQMMVSIQRFNRKETDILELKDELTEIKANQNQEVSSVLSGLSGMIDMVQKNISLLNSKNDQLDRLSKTDGLTSLYNRLYLDSALAAEVNRASRYGTAVSIILLDIDHFKKINDTFGHQTGDKVLIELSKLLLRNIRSTDITGRWGGEEFMIICTETNLHDAVMVGEKIHAILNCTELAETKVTVSMGIAELKQGESVNGIIKRADDAMYNAKLAGRNCIRT
ncbi:MAG: GGDEF domain-containing protein [Deferribacterales bacterium]